MIGKSRSTLLDRGIRTSKKRLLRQANQRADAEEAGRILSRVEDPILRAVLQHHLPVIETNGGWPVCMGCDGDGGVESEPAEWPCSTWILITTALPR